MMPTELEVQYCSHDNALPTPVQFTKWANCVARLAASSEIDAARNMVVRLVDREEMASLNSRWRDKDYATNVLAFPFAEPEAAAHIPLGDIVICPAVVREEAQAQGKPFIDRMAHMLIHGMLHLLAYDHKSPEEAQVMEAVEQEALARLGYAKPYE